jgi:uncharacterized membrane protein
MINLQQPKKENTLNQDSAIVAIYPTHTAAEIAVKELQQSGFDMKKLSIVGRDYHTEENVVGYYNTGDRMQAWGKVGAFWGGLWGFLFGSAFFAIPGLGPNTGGGAVGQLDCGGRWKGRSLMGGLSAVGAGLYSLGIPKDSILRYETALKNDKFVLLVHGSTDDTTHAQAILERTQHDTLEHHPVTRN